VQSEDRGRRQGRSGGEVSTATEIVAYKATEAVLADLASKYKGVVFNVKDSKGMEDAKAAYKDIAAHNRTLEAARVAEKAASLAYGRFVDSEAQRIAEQLDALRLPIKEQIEAETKRVEREREAAIQAEMARQEAEARARKEAEERRMAEERAELDRQRAKFEADQREARERIAAEEERVRREREVVERARREQEERERAERMAKEQAERTARLAEEARQRAAQKAENDKADARGMLASFVERYGKIKEFADVVKAIKRYQGGK
jgi:hypothetical protein